MKATYDVFDRARMVVLYELPGQTELPEVIAAKHFEEEASLVLEQLGHEHRHRA